MLPASGPWPHPYFEAAGATVRVRFSDAAGTERTLDLHHKQLGAGRPIVLVHGLMTSSYSWRYVMKPLADRYRVLVPDLVGSGASEKPLDLRYSVDNVARALAAYVRATCDEPPYLVGNSLGGLYCLRALLADDALARRFVLMHSPGYPNVRMQLLHTLLEAEPLRAFATWLAHRHRRTFVIRNQHYHRDDIITEELVSEYARPFETKDGARVFVRILRESLDPEEHAQIVAALRAKKAARAPFCETLILYAIEDVMVPPAFGPRYAEDIPGARLEWMRDTSHFLQVDSPEETVERIFAFDS